MFHSRKVEPLRRTPAATALDAGATIQDALVRRLRLARAVSAGRRRAPGARGSRADRGASSGAGDSARGPPVVCLAARMPRIPINIAEHVGNTPMVALTRLLPDGVDVELYGKLEAFNPGGSVKDRIGVAMLDAAERDGLIEPGRTTIVEATSGNTGIALAFCCAAKGYDLSIFLPQGMSREREALLRLYGAQVEIVESLGGMNEAVDAARARGPRRRRLPARPVLQPGQPRGPPHRHGPRDPRARSTARSTSSSPASGTGGTITGVGEALKAHNPKATVIGVEPAGLAGALGRRAGPAPHPGHRRGLRPGRARPRRRSTRSSTCSDDDAIATAHAARRARGHPRRHLVRRGAVGRARGRAAPGVARQAHRHRPARLGRALHLGAVLRAAHRSGAAG